MEILILKFRQISIIVLMCICFIANAQYRINIDYETAAQVAANMGMQLVVEMEQNQLIDTILNKQEEILFKSSAIASSKELQLKSLQNTKGFGAESLYYKEIALTSGKIYNLTSEILNSISNSSLAGKANVVAAVTNLSAKNVQLVNDFINIVTNCTVENPLKNKTDAQIKNTKDGYNLIDRYERMQVACQISYDLKKIQRQLQTILYYCNNGNWNTLVKQLDKQTWAKGVNAKSISDKIQNQWKNKILK